MVTFSALSDDTFNTLWWLFGTLWWHFQHSRVIFFSTVWWHFQHSLMTSSALSGDFFDTFWWLHRSSPAGSTDFSVRPLYRWKVRGKKGGKYIRVSADLFNDLLFSPGHFWTYNYVLITACSCSCLLSLLITNTRCRVLSSSFQVTRNLGADAVRI